MFYRVMADIFMVIHFAWILFMLLGLALTVRAFFRPGFFDRWLFRTIHLAGIMFVATLEALKAYCPLTLWENAMRYPNVSPAVVMVPTVLIALFILAVFIVKPPARFRR